MFDQNRFPSAADPGVDHDDMNRAGSEIGYRVLQDQRSSHDVLRRHAMGEIDDLNFRVDRRDDAFHDADKRVLIAKIGSKRYHHGRVSG